MDRLLFPETCWAAGGRKDYPYDLVFSSLFFDNANLKFFLSMDYITLGIANMATVEWSERMIW